jgi:hypothetical protein
MKQKLHKTILLLTAITLISCGGIPAKAKLPLPPELVIPASLKVDASELSGLSDKTLNKLVKRDKLKSARIETLKNIIKSTH